ncbi:MAG TPA: tetratricopeptide repeat protein [Rectinemataceae bacterium]|nr:tetratricopeptide repeat protein [Rectinemataceae bacterium]
MKNVCARGATVAFLVAMLGAIALPSYAQTSIAMASPEVLAKIISSKAEIERNIILATPESLANAKSGLSESKIISEDDRQALLEIVRGISMLLYPAPVSTNVLPAATRNFPPRLNGGGEPAAEFFVDPLLKNINPVYSVCLTQLMEAFHGRIFAAPKGSEGAFLTEILPALAVFKTFDKEVARTALGYAERFESSGSYASAISGLVGARSAIIDGDMISAYHLYKRVLDSYPDVWPARLELGVISLGMEMPVNALAFLSPLMDSRNSDRYVVLPYAIALYRNGRLADAEPYARKGLDCDPESFELMMILTHILVDRNDFAAAQPMLDSYGRKNPADRMFLYLKALLAKGQNRNDEALKWARKALQAYPEDPEIKVLVAGILFNGPDAGHKEASSLCVEAKNRFAADRLAAAESGKPSMSPLMKAMREEAEGEATRFLMLEAYSHQDWYAAAEMLESTSTSGLDKAVVATILRKSGRMGEALAFSSKWYKDTPQSEAAAEAYLRSLAAASTGGGVASAAAPGASDVRPGLIGLMGGFGPGYSDPSLESGQLTIVGLVLQLLSGSCSAGMRSYLHYLSGTLQANTDAAIDCYRMALLERADNVEAIAALAKAYARKNDAQKALYFVKQAKTIGIDDVDLYADLQALEAALIKG